VYYSCNIAGALVVALVFLYTLLLGKPMTSLTDNVSSPVEGQKKTQ
jgi:hypothetical protein